MIPLSFGPPPEWAYQASVIRPATQIQRGRAGGGCAGIRGGKVGSEPLARRGQDHAYLAAHCEQSLALRLSIRFGEIVVVPRRYIGLARAVAPHNEQRAQTLLIETILGSSSGKELVYSLPHELGFRHAPTSAQLFQQAILRFGQLDLCTDHSSPFEPCSARPAGLDFYERMTVQHDPRQAPARAGSPTKQPVTAAGLGLRPSSAPGSARAAAVRGTRRRPA